MNGPIKRGAAFVLPLFLLFTTLQCNTPTLDSQAHALMQRASAYLWAQQAADGGWHSRTHGLLRSGQALTPFILYTLMEAAPIESGADQESAERALHFIRKHTNQEGVIGTADPLLLEYPNYATAYGLRVLEKVGSPQDSTLTRRMAAYLIDQQFDQSRAVQTEHAAFGGWGFGEQTLPAGQVGYVDLSHTRRVLQALRHTSVDTLGTVFENARLFLAGLQNQNLKDTPLENHYDGGFHYSPVVFLANKGDVVQMPDTSIFLSYATATCDGLLALMARGAGKDAPAVRDALQWLARNSTLEYPQGIPPDRPSQWHKVMFYYHLAVRAEVYSVFGWPDGARSAMLSVLKNHVREDGSYLNELGAPNKENDPLLATALALSALQHIGTR